MHGGWPGGGAGGVGPARQRRLGRRLRLRRNGGAAEPIWSAPHLGGPGGRAGLPPRFPPGRPLVGARLAGHTLERPRCVRPGIGFWCWLSFICSLSLATRLRHALVLRPAAHAVVHTAAATAAAFRLPAVIGVQPRPGAAGPGAQPVVSQAVLWPMPRHAAEAAGAAGRVLLLGGASGQRL